MQVALIHNIAVEVLSPSHSLYQLITVGDDMEHKSRHKSAETAARQDYVAGKKGAGFQRVNIHRCFLELLQAHKS